MNAKNHRFTIFEIKQTKQKLYKRFWKKWVSRKREILDENAINKLFDPGNADGGANLQAIFRPQMLLETKWL